MTSAIATVVYTPDNAIVNFTQGVGGVVVSPIMPTGPAGPKGDDGIAVDPTIGDSAIFINISAGQPVYISKVGGQAFLADATNLNSADVAGLAITAAISGSRVSFSRSKIVLNDWTVASGQVSLLPGYDYFLSAIPGQITITPPAITGQCVTFIGTAISTTTLLCGIELPILL